ncbi:MAG: hypothetical protein ACI9J3_001365 [Parvicellaceae bacterium]|jgi:hypothetical protein
MRIALLTCLLFLTTILTAQVQIDAIITTDETCFGANDGTITITASLGTPPYMYDVNGMVQSTNVFTGMVCGAYNVIVTDAAPTTAFGSAIINCATAVFSTISSFGPSCNGLCNGMAFITTTGGTPPYMVNDPMGGPPITYSSTGTLTGLCAGTYTLQISDANACIETQMLTITEPAVISGTVSATDESSSGACDGTATVTASGGTPPYTYNWYTCAGAGLGNVATTAMGLCAGDYYCEITDGNGCQFNTACATVGSGTPPCTMFSNVATTPSTCAGMCDGEIFIVTTGGTPPYVVSGTFAGSPITYTSSVLIPGICAGTYTLTADDAGGCTEFLVATVTEPSPVFQTYSSTDETSAGSCDGTITVTGSGGASPYVYSVDCGLTFQSTPFTGLCSGTYSVMTMDANGCSAPCEPVTISFVGPPCAMVSTYTINQPTCPGSCDGEIFLSTFGGTMPYIVTGPFPGSPVTYTSATLLTGICAGTYTLSIDDAAGCTEIVVVTVTEPMALTLNAIVTDETSAGACDGTITVTGMGGTGTLLYSNDCGATFQASPIFTGLCAGPHGLMIVDANGCTSSCDTYLVNSGTPPCTMVSTYTTVNATCNGVCDGEIVLTTTAGTMPYMVNDPLTGGPTTYTSAYLFTGLCAGTYTLLVQDAGGCSETLIVTINEPSLLFQTYTSSNESSVGACDGNITVTGVGGVSPYQYSIDCGLTYQTGSFTGLCAGFYNVMTMDANGCTTGCETVTIGSGGCTIVSNVTTVPATCFGACDGSVMIVSTGGSPLYTVTDPMGGPDVSYSSIGTFTGICAGTYTLMVTDALGCTEFVVVTITEPTQVIHTYTATNESSTGACDGTITVTGGGGTAGYSYSIDCGVTFQTGSFTGLCAGVYNVMTMDANGCSSGCETVTIGSGGCIIISNTTIIPATCFGACDGTIMIFSTGGSPLYTVTDPMGGPDVSYSSTGTIAGICAGTYTLMVTDALGCTELVVVTMTEPTQVFQTYTATNESSTGSCDGSITVTGGGGTGGYSYSIDCGVTFQTGPFTGLCVGAYNVMTMDANGCTTACEAVTVGTTGCSMFSNVTSTSETCFGSCDGSITIVTTGGTPPYIVLDPTSGTSLMYTSIITIPNVCAGVYTLTITDAVACGEVQVVTVTAPSEVIAIATTVAHPTSLGACNGIATATASGGSGGFNYDWIDCSTGLSIGQTVSTASGLCAGSYAAIATDGNGCSDTSACIDVTDPVSVIENEHSFSFELYPNPTNHLINIKWAQSEDVTITLTDILGKIIFASTVSNKSSVQYNLADMNIRNGVYLVQISNGLFKQTSRLIYSK